MKNRIVVKNKLELKRLIKSEIQVNGKECDLNHIDVSQITDMERLFQYSEFNGDISQWDTSSVQDMSWMFFESKFNGDISQWNVSQVWTMHEIFFSSDFNGDISKWDISNIENMEFMFSKSKFSGNLLEWTPYSANINHIFSKTHASIPYWAEFQDKEMRKTAIDNYLLNKELTQELNSNNINNKKHKI